MSRIAMLVVLAVLGVFVGALTSAGSRAQTTAPACPPAADADVTPRGTGLSVALEGDDPPEAIDVLQHSKGKKVVNARRVARVAVDEGRAVWDGEATVSGRDVSDGVYVLRAGSVETVVRRSRGRWFERPAAETSRACGLVRDLRAVKPAFGGTSRQTLRVTYRVAAEATVGVEVLYGGKVISRTRPGVRKAGVTYTLRLPAKGLPRGEYTFRLTASRGTDEVTARVVSRRV
jgi:hypothetical protein